MKARALQITLALIAGALLTYIFLSESSTPVTKSSRSLASIESSPRLPSEVILSLQQIQQFESEFEQTLALYQLIQPKHVHEIIGLLEEAEIVLSRSDYKAASAIAVTRLTELDHELALNLLLEAERSIQPAWVQSMFHVLARMDLNLAIARVDQIPHVLRTTAIQSIFSSLDDLPNAEKVALADTLGINASRIASLDWNQKIEYAMSLPDGQRKMIEVMQVMSAWGREDPLAAISASRQLSGQMSEIALYQIIEGWAQSDTNAAIEWLQNEPSSSFKANFYPGLIAQLAEQNFESALLLADSLTGQTKDQTLAQISGQWSLYDYDAFRQWFFATTVKAPMSGALHQTISSLATHNPTLLDELIPEIPGPMRKMAESIREHAEISANPAAFAQKITQMDDDEERHNATQTLLSRWLYQDSEAAANWLRRQGEQSDPRHYQQVTAQWSRFDPDAAYAYAESLNRPEAREAAHFGILQSSQDIEALIRFYDSTRNEDLKAQAGQFIHQQLLFTDPERARLYQPEEQQSNTVFNGSGALGIRRALPTDN